MTAAAEVGDDVVEERLLVRHARGHRRQAGERVASPLLAVKFVVAMFTDGAPATTVPFSTIFVPSSSVSEVIRWPGVVTVAPLWTWACLVVSTVIL